MDKRRCIAKGSAFLESPGGVGKGTEVYLALINELEHFLTVVRINLEMF